MAPSLNISNFSDVLAPESIYPLNESEKLLLENIGESKRKVVVFIKFRCPILTNLENFHKPDDAALIGFFAEQTRANMPKNVDKHFDAIFWFQADYSLCGNDINSQKLIPVPELDAFLAQAIYYVPKQKWDLIHDQEWLSTTVCWLRKKYDLPGITFESLEHLTNKAIEKMIAEDKDIPTAKFSLVDFSCVNDVENEVDKIMMRIEKFPMFRKPINGAGSYDCVKVRNKSELKDWVTRMINKKNNNDIYLVEEFVFGIEFSAAVCLLSDGAWAPLYISYNGEKTVVDMLHAGEPLPFHGDRFEDCLDMFPNMDKFVDKVIQAYKPPHPHLLTVQGFQLEKNTDKYYLTELTYRILGARDTLLSYAYSGVSQETALLSCHLDPNYRAEPDPNKPKIFERHLWYPYNEGLLKSHREVDPDAPISSELKFNWLVEVGTKLCKPTWFEHFVVHICLRNPDKKKLLEDIEWMEKNWKPDIIKNE
uniref:ATP-grasp domain-containing protein n=1 Tax=Acrobeloides nanus TaxID=290746 RepID=A0A914BUY2_9BILA